MVKGGSPVRWGVLGTGSIAHKFAEGLQHTAGAELAAVGSRGVESTRVFAEAFGAKSAFPSYAELAECDDVDVVYVAAPHVFHAELAMLCLEAGKPVLCEKPFTVNAQEARAVIELARRKNLFLMEAMWTRFLPAIVRVRELIAEGAIGEPRMLHADFGFCGDGNPEGRLYNPALGGGALLDVGVYPISFASLVFGQPSGVTGQAHLGATGVDEQCAMVLSYPGGQLASLTGAVMTDTPRELVLSGTEGQIRVSAAWHCASEFSLHCRGREVEVVALPFESSGLQFEAEEVGRCLRAGLKESETMPLDETLGIMETMDTLRQRWGLKYPCE